MAAVNQGIAHYGPKGRPVCGNKSGHILVRDMIRFETELKPCKRCVKALAAILALRRGQ